MMFCYFKFQLNAKILKKKKKFNRMHITWLRSGLYINAFYFHFSAFLQVRSKLQSLDGIVPPTHGFMISSTGMKNVWLSMEHQAILWCNQLVVQVRKSFLFKYVFSSTMRDF